MAAESNRQTASSGKSAQDAAREVAKEARDSAKEIGQEAASKARSTADHFREQARSSVEEGKTQVAHQVGGLAQALHKSSEELRNQELGRLAEQGDWLASRIEEFQDYLQNRPANEMLNDLRRVARQQPAWFLGGMFAAGLVAARFLQSGESSAHHDYDNNHRTHFGPSESRFQTESTGS